MISRPANGGNVASPTEVIDSVRFSGKRASGVHPPHPQYRRARRAGLPRESASTRPRSPFFRNLVAPFSKEMLPRLLKAHARYYTASFIISFPLHNFTGRANDHVVLICLSVNRNRAEYGAVNLHRDLPMKLRSTIRRGEARRGRLERALQSADRIETRRCPPNCPGTPRTSRGSRWSMSRNGRAL
jgi:hypothetical protein